MSTSGALSYLPCEKSIKHSLSPWPEGPPLGVGVRTEAADSIMNVVGDPEVSFPSLGPLVVLHSPHNSNLQREVEQRMRNREFI